MKRIGIAAAVAIAACMVPSATHAQSGAQPWSFSVTPYLWLPGIESTLRYSASAPGGGRPEADIDSSPNDYLTDLKFAFMIAGEARRGRLSLFSDLIYLDFDAENSAVRAVDFGGGRVPVDSSLNANTRSKLKGFAWSALAGYSLAHSPQSTHDVFAGVRYLGLKAETGWQLATVIQGPGAGQVFERSGSVSEREDLWDGVVGIRGRFTLGDGRWAVPYYVDVGTGSSRVTWQVAAGVTYAFGWGDLGLIYRHLSYEQPGDKLVSNLEFGGPALSATFRF
jgi:hypothetical protein